MKSPRSHGTASARNVGVELASGDYMLLLLPGDALDGDALIAAAEAIDADPALDLLIFDPMACAAGITRVDPPDWSPTLVLGSRFALGALLARAELLRKHPFRSKFDGLEEYDLVLRASEGPARIGRVPGTIGREPSDLPSSEAVSLQRRAVTEALSRRGLSWRSERRSDFPEFLALRPSRATPEPRVSVVIPTRNRGVDLTRCLESLFLLTNYPGMEVVLVDNLTTDPVARRTIERFPIRHIIHRHRPFRFAHAANEGVREAGGDLLLFLHGDVEVIAPDWLREMVMHFEDAAVGAVGATLLRPDRHVEQAGAVLGPQGAIGPALENLAEDQAGPLGELAVAREVAALSGACLMIRRDTFAELGGFSTDYERLYADADLCLRVREAGYRVLALGGTRLVHHRRPAVQPTTEDFGDRAIFIDRWRPLIKGGDLLVGRSRRP